MCTDSSLYHHITVPLNCSEIVRKLLQVTPNYCYIHKKTRSSNMEDWFRAISIFYSERYFSLYMLCDRKCKSKVYCPDDIFLAFQDLHFRMRANRMSANLKIFAPFLRFYPWTENGENSASGQSYYQTNFLVKNYLGRSISWAWWSLETFQFIFAVLNNIINN